VLERAPGVRVESVIEHLQRVATVQHGEGEKILDEFDLLLDTRKPGDFSLSGQLLVFEAKVSTPRVHLVKSWDFSSIEILPDPEGWLDRHSSAVVRRTQIS
jgi:hypothetical protein